MSKPKTETQAPVEAKAEVVLTTREVAAAMGITPKALRKKLRATEKFDDKKYTRYRFSTVGEVKTLVAPKAAAPTV